MLIANGRRILTQAVFLFAVAAATAQPAPELKALTVKDVMRLVSAGVPEDVIVARIKRAAKPFDLSADEILELRRDGMPPLVLKYLIDPSLPYTPPPPPSSPPAPAPPKMSAPPPPAPIKPAKRFPDDPIGAKVPLEPGLYLPVSTKFAETEMRTLISAKSGGLGTKISAGLVKSKLRAPLVGPKAKLRSSAAKPVFYLRANNMKTDDLVLVLLDRKDDHRELVLVMQGKKPVVEVGRMREFEVTRIDEDLYRVTTTTLKPGEFLLYLVGSADPEKGIFGKGFDFGVDAPARK